jgi:hypothetical protein
MKSLAVFLFFGIAISAQVSTGSLYGRLRVGKASESVEVVAKGSLLQADDSTAGYLINSQIVDALPLDGRNVMSLVTLGPGSIPGNVSASNLERRFSSPSITPTSVSPVPIRILARSSGKLWLAAILGEFSSPGASISEDERI